MAFAAHDQIHGGFFIWEMEQKKRVINWEKIELDYRAGVKTLREIADEHNVSHVAITKRANRDEWTRDLTARIRAKTEALLSKSLVNKEVTKEERLKESEIIDVNAQNNALIQIKQRKDVTRMRDIVAKLAEELEAQESFNARVDCTKKLTESMKSLIDLERRVYKIDDDVSVDSNKRVSIKVNFYDA